MVAIPSLYSVIPEWKEMTCDNLHTEVRLAIAEFFEFDDVISEFTNIKLQHEHQMFLTMQNVQRREYLTNMMLLRIFEIYGSAACDSVYSAL